MRKNLSSHEIGFYSKYYYKFLAFNNAIGASKVYLYNSIEINIFFENT